MTDIPSRLPLPWHWDTTDLTQQLWKEVPKGHELIGKKLKSIGKRQDNDDALFEIEDDEYKYAIVHLTWSQGRQVDVQYPRTTLYKNFESLFNQIIQDHKGWENEEEE